MESGRWYRAQNEKLIFSVLLLCGTISFFVVTDWLWDVFVKPEPRYFGVTPDLRILPLTPLDQPVEVSMGIENWAADTITRALSFDFLSWKRSLSDIRPRFSEEGWANFLKALKKSKLIEIAEKRRVVLHATLDGPSVITATIRGPIFGWEIAVPINLSMETTEGVVGTYRWKVKLLVRRADQRVNPQGIEVHRFLVTKF